MATDSFTLDGRLRAPHGVTKADTSKYRGMLEAALQGDIMADARLREAITTTDREAISTLAHLVNLQTIPQLDKVERKWADIATTRVVPDFRPAVLYSMFGDLTGAGIGENGEAATVPEGTAYPHVTITGQESLYSKLAKRGLKVDYTFEARVNDASGFFGGLPSEIMGVTIDTETAEVYDALINGTGANRKLQGGTLPDDSVVPVNAAVTPNAIHQAIREESNRKVNGRKQGRASGYNVIVSVGTKDFIDFKINRPVISKLDGVTTYAPYDAGAIAGVTTLESDRLSGNEWYLLPKPGSSRRPVLELLKLRGYENPELRTADASYSYDADVQGLRYRYVVGGALWSDSTVVYSSGTGVA